MHEFHTFPYLKVKSDFSDARDKVELGQQAPVVQRVGNAADQITIHWISAIETY